jgi:2-amino-4-ketopentanoate thiolase alpha subunit
MSSIPKGTWVEVERNLYSADRSSPSRPLDPAKVPSYLLRVSGFLLEDAELGQQVRIRTIFGKIHAGKLRIQSPSYGGSFGHTVPELMRSSRAGAL